MKHYSLVTRTCGVWLLAVLFMMPLTSFHAVSAAGSPLALTQVSASVKRQIQGYLDKAWAHYQKKEYDEALKWWHMAAKHDTPAAQYNIALCYERGTGVDADMEKAVSWYKKAAEQNFPGAQYNLAYCYAEGRGVAQDYKAAARWWKAAAEQGLAEAQYNLGWCYYEGHGVKQNYDEAVKWYKRAAEQGNADAIAALSELGELE